MQFRNLIKSNIKNIDTKLGIATLLYIKYLDNLNGNNKLLTLFLLLTDCMSNYGKDIKSVYRINYNLMDCHISSLNDTDINKVLENTNILDNISDHIDAKTTYEYGIQLAVLLSELFIRNIVSVYGDKGINIIKHPNGADAFPDFDFLYNGETYHVEIKASLCKLAPEENKLLCSFNNGINNKNAVLNDIKNKDSLLRNTLCMNIYYYIDIENNAFVYVGVDIYPIVLAVKWKYDIETLTLVDLMTRSNGQNSTNNNALISTGYTKGLTYYNKFELFDSYIKGTKLISDNDRNTIKHISIHLKDFQYSFKEYKERRDLYINKPLKYNLKKYISIIKKLMKLATKIELLYNSLYYNEINNTILLQLNGIKKYIENDIAQYNISY